MKFIRSSMSAKKSDASPEIEFSHYQYLTIGFVSSFSLSYGPDEHIGEHVPRERINIVITTSPSMNDTDSSTIFIIVLVL